MSNTEEFEFFKRIEDLEKTTKALEATEATAQENRRVLLLTFWLAFAATFGTVPHIARATKDQAMAALKKTHLSKQMVDALEETMLDVCDAFERRG